MSFETNSWILLYRTAVSMQIESYSQGNATKDLNRKIDGALGLYLPYEATSILERVSY